MNPNKRTLRIVKVITNQYCKSLGEKKRIWKNKTKETNKKQSQISAIRKALELCKEDILTVT